MRRRSPHTAIWVAALCGVLQGDFLHAESGQNAWLRYAPLDERTAQMYESLPASVTVLGSSAVLETAQGELIRGVRGMLGKTLRAGMGPPKENAFVLGTLKVIRAEVPEFSARNELREDGFRLATGQVGGFHCVIITASTDRGVLYGVFALLSRIARSESFAALNEAQEPYAPLVCLPPSGSIGAPSIMSTPIHAFWKTAFFLNSLASPMCFALGASGCLLPSI